MIRQKTLPMEEPKKKLKELKEYLPDATDELIHVATYLADHLHNQLSPLGFIMAWAMAITDLQKGVDGKTNEPIHNRAVGYPPMIYDLLRMSLPRIADAVLPTSFADGVKNALIEMDI